MKNKRKGFTLIELLAIIVILAIIAVITVPIILNVIDNSRKGAVKNSVYGYKDAVSKYYVTKLYEDQNFKLDGTYTIIDGKMTGTGMDNVEIPVTGNVPTSGSLVYKNNVLESGYLIMDGYNVGIEEGEIKNVSKDNSSNDSSDESGDSDDSGSTETGGITDETTLTVSFTGDIWNDYTTATVSAVISGSVSSDLTYYYYQKKGSDSSTSEYSLIYSGSENTYTYSNLTSEAYTFKVVVEDSAGNTLEGTNVRGPYCFVEGTKVYTENGYVNIEDIKVGDYVYALDLETNEQVLKEVTNTITSNTSELYHLKIEDEVVLATPRHQFYIVDKGWVRAYDLEIGDKVITKDGLKEISQIDYEVLEEPITVYNLEVEGLHNYLVTEYSILVHNGPSLT